MLSMDEWMLNDVLECSVCLEQLDSTSKVLPCQHTFCKRCLEEIVSSRKELRCPECRVLVDIKVDELPCNILLIRILEGMKNAPRNKSIQTSGSDLLELHRGRPQPPIPHHSIPKPGSTDNYIPSPPKQPSSQVQPCARALYSYEAKEPGDLSFKKGDVIILRKKIDQNWFHGELAGKFGFFPASYIQVITPLPTHLCKALYDFVINGNDEKDCLTFSKGDVITVIRRVDENWAEGRLGERIGIFPISFVEMNSAAKSLMKLSTNVQSGPSRVAPPTPSSDSDTTPLITSSNVGGRIVSHPCVSSSSSSSTSSTSTSSSSSSSSSTSSPSSPPALVTQLGHPLPPPPPTHSHHHNNSQQPHPPPLYQLHLQQQREKRHSFVGMHHSRPAPPLPSSNRHSLELISSSQSSNQVLTADHVIPPAPSSVPLIPVPVVHPKHKHSSQEMPPAPSSVPLIPVPVVHPRHKHGSQVSSEGAHLSLGKSPQDTSGCSSTPNLSLSADNCGPPTHVSVPIFYLALYAYKPQKEDELELRKGELYTVSEKCQDGWFKGTSLRTGSSGVFPGNYVQAAKSSLLQAHFRQTSSSLASVRPTTSRTGSLPFSSPTRSSGRSHSSMVSNGRSGDSLSRARAAAAVVSERTQGFLDWARSVTALAVPPKPPHPHSPRFQSHTSPRQSGHRSAAPELPPRVLTQIPEPSTTSPIAGLVAPQPAISQSWHGTPSTPPQPGPLQSAPMSRSMLSAAVAITPPNISMSSAVVSSTSTPTPASSSGQTQRYEKVLKSGKRHRKGSDKVSFVKMLTIKKKGKLPVQCAYSMDNPVFVDCTPPSNAPSVSAAMPPANHVRSESCPSDVVFTSNTPQCGHRKSNSIDGSTDGTITSANNGKVRPKQPAPLVRERFRCIVPYPPNSEYELELKVGDIIYVHKKRDDGWYKGTLNRTGKTGLFPGSFVEGF